MCLQENCSLADAADQEKAPVTSVRNQWKRGTVQPIDANLPGTGSGTEFPCQSHEVVRGHHGVTASSMTQLRWIGGYLEEAEKQGQA